MRPMRRLALLLALAVIATPSLARAESGCDAKAAEKKLAGAAKASFLKKCEKDAAEAGCAQRSTPGCAAQPYR